MQKAKVRIHTFSRKNRKKLRIIYKFPEHISKEFRRILFYHIT